MNSVVLSGRLTDDIRLREKEDRSWASFTIAVEKDYIDKSTGKRPVDFVDCVAFRYQAEYGARWGHKGDFVEVKGSLDVKMREKHGIMFPKTTVIVDDFRKIHSKQNSKTIEINPDGSTNEADDEEEDNDSELPFEMDVSMKPDDEDEVKADSKEEKPSEDVKSETKDDDEDDDEEDDSSDGGVFRV